MGTSRIRLALALLGAAFVTGAAFPTCAPAQPPYWGVNVHSVSYGLDDADMDRELDAARDLGANLLRIDIAWKTLEADGSGQYSQAYVARLDRFVGGAAARGLKVELMLYTTPCWASSAPDDVKQGCAGDWDGRGVGKYPPADPADYASAARFLAARYGAALAAFEVWNEPNQQGFLTSSDPAAAYTAIVRAAYPAIKAVAPSLTVVAGALALCDRPFLEQLYAAGIEGSYDALSVHPYSDDRDPADPYLPGAADQTFLDGLLWIRQAQQAAGDTAPVWVDEFGWNTSAVRGQQWGSGVDEATQATYVAKAFGMFADPSWGLGFVAAGAMYDLRDLGTDPSDPEQNYGLLRLDFSQKPAFAALRSEFSTLAAASAPISSSQVVAPPPVTPAPAPAASAPPAAAPQAPIAAAPFDVARLVRPALETIAHAARHAHRHSHRCHAPRHRCRSRRGRT